MLREAKDTDITSTWELGKDMEVKGVCMKMRGSQVRAG